MTVAYTKAHGLVDSPTEILKERYNNMYHTEVYE